MPTFHHCTRALSAAAFVIGMTAGIPVAAAQSTSASGAAPGRATPDRLDAEITRLLEAMDWPRMVDVFLRRGDLQKVAKRQLTRSSPEALACVDRGYNRTLVLQRIAAGYRAVYSDPALVAATSRFMALPASQRILDAAASRSPESVASAPHEASRPTAWDELSPAEQEAYERFAASEAGQTYMRVRSAQQLAQQDQLHGLAAEVASRCSR